MTLAVVQSTFLQPVLCRAVVIVIFAEPQCGSVLCYILEASLKQFYQEERFDEDQQKRNACYYSILPALRWS